MQPGMAQERCSTCCQAQPSTLACQVTLCKGSFAAQALLQNTPPSHDGYMQHLVLQCHVQSVQQ